MSESPIELARAAMAAHESLKSFSATQRITAGGLNAEAQIRYKRPGQVTVEYRSYQDPLSEFEERLFGGAEFVADELMTMQLIYDGRDTWLKDTRQNVALHKQGKILYSPLRGINILAELGFLNDLTRDFLIRKEGEETIDGRAVQRLGLKPKVRYRSLLLKEETFPISHATIALDAETSFPLKITYTPTRHSSAYYLLGASTPITIKYKNPRVNTVKDEVFSFVPPEGTRVFYEHEVGRDELTEKLPFDLPLEKLEQEKYVLTEGKAQITANADNERAYTLIPLVPGEKREDTDDQLANFLSLRVGNYLSRNMSRRRALLSEKGEQLFFGDITGRFLDRGSLVKDRLPNGAERNILEIGWEKDSVYWFLLSDGLSREALVEIAKTLL
jgi:outer membrane lipoprotein-sorting protein